MGRGFTKEFGENSSIYLSVLHRVSHICWVPATITRSSPHKSVFPPQTVKDPMICQVSPYLQGLIMTWHVIAHETYVMIAAEPQNRFFW